jgi:transcriptional regulator with XRE-family HTH domain
MNGTGQGASEWIQILQALTFRTDLRFLTMISWKEVLPQGQLLRPKRAWCPACYEEWRDREAVIYEPLLWTLKAATVCQRHGEPLRTVCSRCKKSLCPLASRSRAGYCSACGTWLGKAAKHKRLSDAGHHLGVTEEQLWAASAVGELLAEAPGLPSVPTRQGMLKSFSEYIKGHVGNLPALARFLGVNKATLWQWSKGKQLLQLESLLKLCYRLEMSLLEFVTGATISKGLITSTTISLANRDEAKPPARTRKALDRAEAARTLQSALTETPPPSLQRVAARLGRDGNTLRYQFADLCKSITQRYAAYKKARSAERWEGVEYVLRQVLNGGEAPSMAQVALRLGYDVKTLRKQHPDLCHEISLRHANRRKNRWKEARLTLQGILTEQPPPSVLKVAERLGLSKSSLYKHLPSLCRQIAARYVNHRRRHSAVS